MDWLGLRTEPFQPSKALGLADWPPDVSNSLRLGNACIITGYPFWQWGFQEVLEYLTGARAVDIHSQVVDHDPGFLVGFF